LPECACMVCPIIIFHDKYPMPCMYHCLPVPESTFVCSPGSDRDSKMRLDVLENLAPSPLIFTQIGVVLAV